MSDNNNVSQEALAAALALVHAQQAAAAPVPNTTPIAPEVKATVSFDNEGGAVISSPKIKDGIVLSRDRVNTLKNLQRFPDAFQAQIDDYVKRALDAELKSKEWTERKDNLKMSVNVAKSAGKIEKGKRAGQMRRAIEAGRYLNVLGTGTGQGASFTKKQGLVFYANIAEFKRLLDGMPDFDTQGEEESEE